MAAVNQDGAALESVSEDLQRDWEIVMAAVNQSGNALNFASEDIKKHREIVMAGVKQNGCALKFAYFELRVTVMLFLRQRSITALHYNMQI